MGKTILPFFIIIVIISFFGTYCFADNNNKAPIFQATTDTECIKKTGVNLSWVESFKTESYVHYLNRPIKNALVVHKVEMLLFVIKGFEEIYVICGQEYLDGTQKWQLFTVDIYDDEDEFTRRYKLMLLELVNMIPESEKKCIIKND
jgi:hypothetical protein